MRKALDTRVRTQAKHRCEYCHLPQASYLLRFQIDHVIAQQHGGKTDFQNLCLACPRCNTKKGPNIAGRGEGTDQVVRLFHPRTDAVLAINERSAIEFRRGLMEEGLFSLA